MNRSSNNGAATGAARRTTDEADSKSPRIRVRRYLPLVLLLGVAVHLLLPQLAPIEHSLALARDIPPWLLVLAASAQIISYAGNGYLLKSSVALFGETLSAARGAVVTLGAASVGLVGGGTVGNSAAVVRWLRTSNISVEASLFAGWLPSVLNPGLEVTLGFLGLLYLLLLHRLPPLLLGSVAMGAATLGAIIVAVAWSVRRPDTIRGWTRKLASIYARLRRRSYDPLATERGFDRIAGAWGILKAGGWTGPALGAGVNVVFDMLTLYLLFVAVGHSVSPGILLAGYGIPLLLGKLTILPGGLGIVEGSMAAMFEGLGVPSAVTVVVVVLYRVFSFWTPMLLGIAAAIELQHTAHRSAGAT